jgi:hypothetical protein
MKSFHVAALAAILLLGGASSASAEITLLAEWLIRAEPVTTLTSVRSTWTITLINLLIGVKVAEIDCVGVFDGTVGPSGEAEITEVLDTLGNKVGLELVGISLNCESLLGNSTFGCNVNELAEVWVKNLPWHSLLILWESGAFLEQLQGSPGYHVICVITGSENLCVGETSRTMTNEANDVHWIFEEITLPEAACNKVGKGMWVGEGLMETLNGETLAVSSV